MYKKSIIRDMFSLIYNVEREWIRKIHFGIIVIPIALHGMMMGIYAYVEQGYITYVKLK